MSDCEYTRKAAAFHDGELPSEEDRRMAEHLRHCDQCAQELDRLQRISSALRTARLPGIPPAALSRVHARVKASSALPVLVMLSMARRAAMAAAVVLVVCALWLWQLGGVAAAEPSEEWERGALAEETEMLAEASQNERMARWILEDLSETEEN